LGKCARRIAVFVATNISENIRFWTFAQTRPVVPEVLVKSTREMAELVLCFSNSFFLKRESAFRRTVAIPIEILIG